MPQKKESGIALVMALFILIVIMMLGAVFTMMMASETNTSVRESQSTKALYLADAGLQYAQYSAGKTKKDTGSLASLHDKYSIMNLGDGSFSIHYYYTAPELAVSSWGRIYDSTLDYWIIRHIAAQLE